MSKQSIATVVAEFIGTYLLATVTLGLVVRTQFPFFAAVAAGLAVATATVVFSRRTLPHLNPAVTIGLWTVRKAETTTALVCLAVQMLAGFVAYKFNPYILDTPLRDIAGNSLEWHIIVAQALGALVFGMAFAYVVYERLERLAAAGVLAIALTVGILVASLASNPVLNPAVALATYSWSASYVVGPIIGTVLGIVGYSLLLAPEDKKSSRVATKRR